MQASAQSLVAVPSRVARHGCLREEFEAVIGARIHVQLDGYAVPHQAPCVFQVLLDEEIERTHGNERGRQTREIRRTGSGGDEWRGSERASVRPLELFFDGE